MTKDVVKYTLLGIMVVVLLVGLVFGVRWVLAPVQGSLEQRETVLGSGDYRIAAYEQFYDKCASVQALEDQIETMELNESLPSDQKEANLLALTNQRNSLIRQYNADARKEDTQANFLASDLPYQLNKNGETTCIA